MVDWRLTDQLIHRYHYISEEFFTDERQQMIVLYITVYIQYNTFAVSFTTEGLHVDYIFTKYEIKSVFDESDNK